LITKEDIRKIIEDEISADICHCALGDHVEIAGRDVAVDKLYDAFLKESVPEQRLPSASDQEDSSNLQENLE
jgi:hypothetical protein